MEATLIEPFTSSGKEDLVLDVLLDSEEVLQVEPRDSEPEPHQVPTQLIDIRIFWVHLPCPSKVAA